MTPLSRKGFLQVAGLMAGSTILPIGRPRTLTPINPGDHIGMLYDTTLCVGCNACTNACRQWNHTASERDASGLYDAPQELTADTWTLIQLYQGEGEASFVKRQCMHCVYPGCVSGCPVHALQKTAEGPVTYDPDRCIGCRYCMYACPFHVPRFEWNKVIPEIKKCTLCDDRILSGLGPACAEICPTGALIWGKRNDLLAEAHARLDAEPKRYINHVYGEDDAGGTSVLYLSHVPFDKLGLPIVSTEPVPHVSEEMSEFVLPAVIIGGTITLAAIRLISRRGVWEESWPL
jgi:formate dehydrogenase beta subunit